MKSVIIFYMPHTIGDPFDKNKINCLPELKDTPLGDNFNFIYVVDSNRKKIEAEVFFNN